ncbi:MAG TPA: heme-binding domain-containing protein [Acidobacteriaceae bacterium]|nr:heme-binding domain-containing protein [Acidobacteriaceae bacterium]
MNRLPLIGLSTVLATALSLLLARVHLFGNAGLYSHAIVADPIPAEAAMPVPVRALLNQKCVDCHSSQARAPFYGHFAPVSWLLERDIVAARREMNLSNWTGYTPDQQDVFKSKILQQPKSGEMPPLQYRVIHWSSRITPADIQVLAAWAGGEQANDVREEAAQAGDPVSGKAVFERRCTGCHALTTDREGPRLQGVVGRRSASVPGFPYSTAVRQANIIWSEETLDRWLTDPDSLIPNSNMDFRVPQPQERKDLIAYLGTMAAGR